METLKGNQHLSQQSLFQFLISVTIKVIPAKLTLQGIVSGEQNCWKSSNSLMEDEVCVLTLLSWESCLFLTFLFVFPFILLPSFPHVSSSTKQFNETPSFLMFKEESTMFSDESVPGKRSRWTFKTSAVVSCSGSVNVARWMKELAPSSSCSSSSSSSPHAMHAARAVWNFHTPSFHCCPGLNHWPLFSDFCSQLFISDPLLIYCYFEFTMMGG